MKESSDSLKIRSQEALSRSEVRMSPCLFAVTNLVGYLLAVIPPLVLDPRLETHVRFGARSYDHGWLVCIIAPVVFGSTYALLRKAKSEISAILGATVPLLVGYGISLPILRPECPHGNIICVGTVWTTITLTSAWLHYSTFFNIIPLPLDAAINARIEFIKERLSTCRTILIGFGAGYVGLVITAIHEMHNVNKNLVTDDGEAFILNINSDLIFSLFSVFFVIAIILPLARHCNRLAALFLTINAPENKREN